MPHYYSQNCLSWDAERRYRIECIDRCPIHYIDDKEILLAKQIHTLKQDARLENESNLPPALKTGSTLISTVHNDYSVFFGILAEFKIAKLYGGQELARHWFDEQMNHVERIRKTNIFDCEDIGRTQIRAIDWKPRQMMSMIIREKDFRSKAYQPTIGCVINLNDADGGKWMRIIGWISYDEIRNLPEELIYDPQGRGNAYWIPPYMLNPIDSFNIEFLHK